jgi:hypothetical protein
MMRSSKGASQIHAYDLIKLDAEQKLLTVLDRNRQIRAHYGRG